MSPFVPQPGHLAGLEDDVEAHDPDVERPDAVDVGRPQVDVADPDLGVDRPRGGLDGLDRPLRPAHAPASTTRRAMVQGSRTRKPRSPGSTGTPAASSRARTAATSAAAGSSIVHSRSPTTPAGAGGDALAAPRVEAEVVVVAARGDERRARHDPPDLEADEVAVEGEPLRDVADVQVQVAHAQARADLRRRRPRRRSPRAASRSPAAAGRRRRTPPRASASARAGGPPRARCRSRRGRAGRSPRACRGRTRPGSACGRARGGSRRGRAPRARGRAARSGRGRRCGRGGAPAASSTRTSVVVSPSPSSAAPASWRCTRRPSASWYQATERSTSVTVRWTGPSRSAAGSVGRGGPVGMRGRGHGTSVARPVGPHRPWTHPADRCTSPRASSR